MPKLPRLTAEEAERILLKAGFEHVRTKGSHKIYRRDKERLYQFSCFKKQTQ
ncbi:MAG: type II toxin-antitoxin system HicA family toxin [Deltaproteobacteria bacterium]|nr:type II toxin-antitoxin system HicA family toxin [Deltaproteobacteria bacterium]